MEVVVCTPHGDADITVEAANETTTLADLIEAVTGQASPATARIDGRVVATSTTLTDATLVVGSMIDTRSGNQVADTNRVMLTQLAGRGAGVSVPLASGNYRVGSARRTRASELERAPVESSMFDLIVSDSGDVRARPGSALVALPDPYRPLIGNDDFTTELTVGRAHINVGGRVFRIGPAPSVAGGRDLPTPNPDGTVPFHRGRLDQQDEPPLIVGAQQAAFAASGTLWRHRLDGPDAYSIPFGFHRNGNTTVAVDFRQHGGLAIVGSERFSSGLARALLVELVSRLGPADAAVAVATTASNASSWDWVRWLPHARRGGVGTMPDILIDNAAMASYCSTVQRTAGAAAGPGAASSRHDAWQPPRTPSVEPRMNILILDDVPLWSQRDSPLRTLITNPPPELRIIALCRNINESPGRCTAIVEEIEPSRAFERSGISDPPHPDTVGSLADLHIRRDAQPQIIADIRPAIVEIDVANEVARLLAPLDDVESQHGMAVPTRVAAPSLSDLVDASIRNDVGTELRVGVGLTLDAAGESDEQVASIDLTGGGTATTLFAAADQERHDVAMASMLLGAAARRTPEELAIIVIGDAPAQWHDEVPHMAGWISKQDAHDPTRLVLRIAYVLTERPALDVLVVLEDAPLEPEAYTNPLLAGLSELSATLGNVHLLLTTVDAELDVTGAASRGPLVWVAGDGTGLVVESGTSTAFVAAVGQATAAAAQAARPTEELVVQPARRYRSLTTLERRLARVNAETAQRPEVDEHAATAVARHVAHERPAAESNTAMALLPPPLPENVIASTLLARHRGDGVPLGLVDRPEQATTDVYWWHPGPQGSIVAIGSPRSQMTSMIDTLLVGIAARFSADDLHIYGIDALPQRRRAFDALPHTGDVVDPDDHASVTNIVGALRSALNERVSARRHDNLPDVLLVVGDIGRLSRSLPAHAADVVLTQLGDIAATGAAVGINLVATATRGTDLGPIARMTGDRLIGAVAEANDRLRLGAPLVTPSDRHARRCWSARMDRRVQLAAPADSVEHDIAVMAPSMAMTRPAPSLRTGDTP